MKIFEIITLFPEAFPGTLNLSILKKARKKHWDLKIHNLRDYGIGNHKIVDDKLFSGLPGMLIRPDVIENVMQAINFVGKRIFLTPRGKQLNQQYVEDLAMSDANILLLCGRYEGIDQRAIEYFKFEEISIGNYILAGAEVAALVLMEAVIRKIPKVVGNQKSFENESFVDNEISESRFTRPAVWRTLNNEIIPVDEILISGHHKNIASFQKKNRRKIE